MSVLPETLIKQFARATKDTQTPRGETFLYGTAHVVDNHLEVHFDGADEDVYTPCSSTVAVDDDDRVVVMLKGRQAVITSNITSPSGNADSFGTVSDGRVKENLQAIGPDLGRLLEPVMFNFIGKEGTHYGFVAQDVRELIPEAVRENRTGGLLLNYNELIAPTLALVQDQERRIDELERRIKELESERDQKLSDEE